MQKFEITITPDYVPDWTTSDAIRELFQNGIDQETAGSKFSYEYSDGKLSLSNDGSKLSTKTLLFGSSTKSGDDGSIGQFGEGYKLATLVLIREGKNITFYNNQANEIWRPRFINSRRFGCEVLCFFVEQNQTTAQNLEIIIDGIDEQKWNDDIVPSNLILRDDYSVLSTTEYGRIIDLKGDIFVNGLFVCKDDSLQFGYDFKPQYLSLGRDRRLVSSFDLQWLTSKAWLATKQADRIAELSRDGADDVRYIENTRSYGSDMRTTFTIAEDTALKMFVNEYGENAVPVSSQDEIDKLPAGYTGVVVNERYRNMIVNSDKYIPVEVEEEPSPVDKLKSWVDEYNISDKLGSIAYNELQDIIDAIEEAL